MGIPGQPPYTPGELLAEDKKKSDRERLPALRSGFDQYEYDLSSFGPLIWLLFAIVSDTSRIIFLNLRQKLSTKFGHKITISNDIPRLSIAQIILLALALILGLTVIVLIVVLLFGASLGFLFLIGKGMVEAISSL